MGFSITYQQSFKLAQSFQVIRPRRTPASTGTSSTSLLGPTSPNQLVLPQPHTFNGEVDLSWLSMHLLLMASGQLVISPEAIYWHSTGLAHGLPGAGGCAVWWTPMCRASQHRVNGLISTTQPRCNGNHPKRGAGVWWGQFGLISI